MNLVLGLKEFPGLSLAGMLALLAVVTVASVACVAIEFLYGLNFLFDAAAAPADLFDFLPEKLLLIFF